MKYLDQIIVLQKHIYDLSDENRRLANLQNSAETDEVNAELSKRISENGEEVVDTLNAITALKEVK